MKLTPDPAIAKWLLDTNFDQSHFAWDRGNLTKNLKHRVTRTEIELLLDGLFIFAGRITEPVHEEKRWLLLGETNSGRRLSLIFTIRDKKLRPICCRSMRTQEEKFYEKNT